MPPLTDDAWLSLRDAVPSFRDRWETIASSQYYDAAVPYSNIHEFVTHLLDLIETGENPAEQRAFFAGLERDLSKGSEGVREFLTIGLLEGFTDDVEERGLDFRILYGLLAGSASRAAWLKALAYTHPEMHWSDEQGPIRKRPLTPIVGRFRATYGRPLPDRDAFLVAGEIREGQAEPGQILRFRVSSGLHLRAPIAAVEDVIASVGPALTGLVLPYVNDRSAAYYEGIFWGVQHEPMDLDIALAEED